MSALAIVRQLWAHNGWADAAVAQALVRAHGEHDAVWREYLHILGAQEIWLARIAQREPRVGVWPALEPSQAEELRGVLVTGYAALVGSLGEEDLPREVSYTTTDGRAFTNTLGDILVHVALHGQYHRGKVNQLLRQQDAAPAPVDFIAFVRGAPAATQANDSSS